MPPQMNMGNSPGMPPQGMPPMDPGSQPASPDQKQELLSKISDMQGKAGNLSANKLATDDREKSGRIEALNKIFELMQLAGVDLTDRESVTKFIEGLRQRNPELAQQFEAAMAYFLQDEEMGQGIPAGVEGAVAPQGPGMEAPGTPGINENNNENIIGNEELPKAI